MNADDECGGFYLVKKKKKKARETKWKRRRNRTNKISTKQEGDDLVEATGADLDE